MRALLALCISVAVSAKSSRRNGLMLHFHERIPEDSLILHKSFPKDSLILHESTPEDSLILHKSTPEDSLILHESTPEDSLILDAPGESETDYDPPVGQPQSLDPPQQRHRLSGDSFPAITIIADDETSVPRTTITADDERPRLYKRHGGRRRIYRFPKGGPRRVHIHNPDAVPTKSILRRYN